MERVAISHKQFLKIHRDYERSPAMADLVYVSDSVPGIHRVKKARGFAYTFQDKVNKDKAEIERNNKLVIPPAWTNVWICRLPNGHIQVTGR